MNVRQTDPIPPGVRVTREVPLWGIIVLLLGGLGQAIVAWTQLQSFGDTLRGISVTQQQQSASIAEISRSLNTTNLKDLEHDLKIQSLTNRISAFEALYPRQVLQQVAPAVAK